MNTAWNVFVNGMTGVFAGMGVLYLTMKILAKVAARFPSDPSSEGSASSKKT